MHDGKKGGRAARRKKKKDTFLETHFGNSKLGRDEAAEQEFP
jgi:hypothetical protein